MKILICLTVLLISSCITISQTTDVGITSTPAEKSSIITPTPYEDSSKEKAPAVNAISLRIIK